MVLGGSTRLDRANQVARHRPGTSVEDYNFLVNNCGDPVQRWLNNELGLVTGPTIFPAGLGSYLLESGLVEDVTVHMNDH